jgi:spore cortex biosynthesis protein YabQ
MEIPISQQLIQAASSLILGAAAGFLYDFFRVVRRRARSKAVTAATDFLFWLVTGLAVFLLGLSLGGGRQRVFMNIAAILGAVVYFLTLSRFSLVLCNALADAVTFLFFCLTRPFVWGYRTLKKLSIFLKNIFHYAVKWYKIDAGNMPRPRQPKQRVKKRGEGVMHEAQTSRYYYEDRHIRPDRLRVGDSYQLRTQIDAARAEQESIRQQVEEKETSNAELNYEIEHSDDEDTIADVARDDWGLSRPANGFSTIPETDIQHILQ